MKLASWLVASHHRPELLAATLEHLRDIAGVGAWPYGWQYEIVVAHAASDRVSADIAHRAGAVVVPTTEPHCTGKRNAALRECLGELVLVTDDDDFQSPQRPALAVAAYEAGARVSSIREYRRLHLATGTVVRYCGRGRESYGAGAPDLPPVPCGTAHNYARGTVQQFNGWNPKLATQGDSDLYRRVTRRRGDGPTVCDHDLGGELAATTIITQHGSNAFDRPEVAKGESVVFGSYHLVGEGHWTEIDDFPDSVAQRLIAVGKL